MEKSQWTDSGTDSSDEESVYTEEGREILLEEEELSAMEDAFMQGYEKAFD